MQTGDVRVKTYCEWQAVVEGFDLFLGLIKEVTNPSKPTFWFFLVLTETLCDHVWRDWSQNDFNDKSVLFSYKVN